jgi:hypothetical protein
MGTFNGYEVKEGTRIYYSGDMANCGDFGVVKRAYSDKWGAFFDIHLDDGRSIKGLHQISFNPGPGRRFMAFAEYQEDRQKKLLELQKIVRKQ